MCSVSVAWATGAESGGNSMNTIASGFPDPSASTLRSVGSLKTPCIQLAAVSSMLAPTEPSVQGMSTGGPASTGGMTTAASHAGVGEPSVPLTTRFANVAPMAIDEPPTSPFRGEPRCTTIGLGANVLG